MCSNRLDKRRKFSQISIKKKHGTLRFKINTLIYEPLDRL